MDPGISLLGGWLSPTVEIVTGAVLVTVVWRTGRRWWLRWVPVAVALGVAVAATARWLVNRQGLASDVTPLPLWLWSALFVASVAIAVLGWRASPWWRRGLSILLVPLTFACVALTLNQWVGYYPSVQVAWAAATGSPVPGQADASDLPGLRGTTMATGRVVPLDIPAAASAFGHRTEYVYLPPAWFVGDTPPALPAVLMIGGEFNTAADWIRTGDATATADAYARAHGGHAPILVFVDAGGRFDNDTECVDGPRGNAASHLVDDVRPYVVSTFGAAPDPAHWGVVGWSMGGTCAVDLTVMHPELFTTFEDIAGDVAPTAGTDEQTLDRLYGGDTARRDRFDPTAVMTRHGPYAGVSGWFQVARGSDEAAAADRLCTTAAAVGIGCTVHTVDGRHTWQFAARAFADALPWLAAQITTPGSR